MSQASWSVFYDSVHFSACLMLSLIHLNGFIVVCSATAATSEIKEISNAWVKPKRNILIIKGL